MSERNISLAAERVQFDLTYARSGEPRRVHGAGIDGPSIPNAYTNPDSDDTASGCWEDPEHPEGEAKQRAHVDRWFMTAVREAIHEACEWYRVDGLIYLDPHGPRENEIHLLSERFAQSLVALRTKSCAECGAETDACPHGFLLCPDDRHGCQPCADEAEAEHYDALIGEQQADDWAIDARREGT